MTKLIVPEDTGVRLLPSLICLDAGNLLREVEAYREAGFTTMHADFIDGHFSPSMPLGFNALRSVREHGNVELDVHLMVEDSDYFLEEILDIGAESVSFHIETVRHPQNWINRLKAAGIKAGVAIKPATPVSALDCVLYDCDFVLLMLINPGYAHTSSERQIGYAGKKIMALKEQIARVNPECEIMLDGRITTENIINYTGLGASAFVLGTSCFNRGLALEENVAKLNIALGSMP